jgi:hypothetical protein
MAAPAQILANRSNAQKSTGPRTAEGKAASRPNALKHGLDAESLILPGENPAAYDDSPPITTTSSAHALPPERFHVDTMIRADWSKRRLQHQETELYRIVLAEAGKGASLVTAIRSGTRPPSSSPASSARSSPSSAPGIAPMPNSSAPAPKSKPPRMKPSSTVRAPSRPSPNWLRSRKTAGRRSPPGGRSCPGYRSQPCPPALGLPVCYAKAMP